MKCSSDERTFDYETLILTLYKADCQPKTNRPTNIYLVVYLNNKQVKLSTGVKVYPEHWNIRRQQAYVNARLSKLDNNNNTITNDR